MVRPARAPLIAATTVELAGVGTVGLAASAIGLARLWFPGHGETDAVHLPLQPRLPILAQAATELGAWAAGSRAGFAVHLDPGPLPPFIARVLTELRLVPHGTTISYGALAVRCGRPGAARAVGQAMARNPLPIVIPCHRVVAAQGMGGFSPGLALKHALWAIEGIPTA